MRFIKLRGKSKFSALVDDDDYERLSKLPWHFHKSGGYAASGKTVSGAWKTVLMHRLILGASKGNHVDHINGDGLDNRKSNLRFCNRSENICNRKLNKNNTTGYKGVYKRKKGWSVTIQKDRIQIHIGHYASKRDAMIAYDAAAVALHRHFAKTNQSM